MTDGAPHPPGLRRAWAAAMTAFIMHNAEEVALDLPAWRAEHPVLPWLDWMATPGLFSAMVAILTLAVGALALYCMAVGPSWSRTALFVFSLVMLTNAVSHIALSFVAASLMPGAITAVAVLAPVFACVLWAIRR